MENTNIVLKDFQKAVDEFVESASAKSRQEAAELAMILLVLDVQKAKAAISGHTHNLPETFDDFADLAEDELAGSQKYLGFYQHAGDDSYKQLAKQELSHAAFWIEKAKAIAKTPEQQEHIKSYKRQHDDIAHALPAR